MGVKAIVVNEPNKWAYFQIPKKILVFNVCCGWNNTGYFSAPLSSGTVSS